MEAVAAVVASTFQKGGVTLTPGGAVALPPWGHRHRVSWDRKL